MPLNLINKLENVHERKPEGQKEVLIAKELEKLPFRFVSFGGHGRVDSIGYKGKVGFGFAFAKFDSAFRETVAPGQFRYKTDEVEVALTAIIEKYGLSENVNYDSGNGMFVYNIWEK